MGSFKPLFRAFIRHKSVSFVVVESVRVGLALRTAQLLVLAYGFYKIFFDRQYFYYERPRGFANTWADYFDPTTTGNLVYCNNPAYDFQWSPEWTYIDNKCGTFETGEVFKKLDNGGLYIQTYLQSSLVTQENCTYTGHKCTNVTRDSTNMFVTGLDNVYVGMNVATHTSFRSEKDVYTEVIAADGKSIMETFQAGGYVYISLEEALQAAGIDGLDSKNNDAYESSSIGFAAYRMTGLLLLFEFEYSNKDTWDGKEVKAQLRVKDAQVGWAGTGSRADVLIQQDSGDGTYGKILLDDYSYGVKIQIVYSGEIGTPTVERFVSVIIEYAVLFTFATIFADLVAEYLDCNISKQFRESIEVATVKGSRYTDKVFTRGKSALTVEQA